MRKGDIREIRYYEGGHMRGLIVKCAGALSQGSGKNCDTLLPICVH